jgi:hypothetical protein
LISKQRFGSGKLERPGRLIETIETLLAEFEEVVAEGVGLEPTGQREQGIPARPAGCCITLAAT